MRPHLAQGEIRPKISTMPRQKTEAAAYLDIYKLTVEKKRLQQELDGLEERRQRLQKRLGLIITQVADLEKSAQKLRDTPLEEPSQVVANQAPAKAVTETFDMVFLEY